MNKRNVAAKNGTDDTEGKSLTGLLQSAPVVERLRNPFADEDDDEDDENANNDNSDDDGEDNAAGGWHRGGWWRGMMKRGREIHNERFGDGRDDSDDSHEGEDEDDEEFGDFAIPDSAAGGGDREREKVLLKPLPVHPPPGGTSKFGGLWPFDSLGFGSKDKEKGKEEGLGGGTKEDEDEEEEPEVVGEDGNRVSRAIEAKRRTSIEDPDEDEEVML